MLQDLSTNLDSHMGTIKKVHSYFENLQSQLVQSKLTNKQRTDFLGAISESISKITKFVSEEKKKLVFDNEGLTKGEYYIAKRTIVDKNEIDVLAFSKEVSPTDFIRCVKVVAKNAEVFLPKAKLEKLKNKVSEESRITFTEK